MSERMTDKEWMEASNLAQQWWTPEHVGMRVVREAERARASEDQKDATIKALADALVKHARQVPCPNCGGVGSQACATCDHGEKPTHHPEVIAALRLAGRLP